MKRLFAVLAIVVFVLTAVVPPAAAAKKELRVFAAASLAGAFGDMARLYEKAHKGTSVKLNLAGSQALVAQIEQGAQADVYASADDRWMGYLGARSLLADSAIVFAHNRLVMIVPKSNPARIGRLQDLAHGGTKVVIGADAVPAGHYTRTVLTNLSRDPAFGRDYANRVLANVVSEEENVKSIVGRVQLGEADAGFVYRSDVTSPVGRYVRMFEIPEAANVLAAYPIAALANAVDPASARAFVDLVRSPEGQRILARWEFLGATVAAH